MIAPMTTAPAPEGWSAKRLVAHKKQWQYRRGGGDAGSRIVAPWEVLPGEIGDQHQVLEW